MVAFRAVTDLRFTLALRIEPFICITSGILKASMYLFSVKRTKDPDKPTGVNFYSVRFGYALSAGREWLSYFSKLIEDGETLDHSKNPFYDINQNVHLCVLKILNVNFYSPTKKNDSSPLYFTYFFLVDIYIYLLSPVA